MTTAAPIDPLIALSSGSIQTTAILQEPKGEFLDIKARGWTLPVNAARSAELAAGTERPAKTGDRLYTLEPLIQQRN